MIAIGGYNDNGFNILKFDDENDIKNDWKWYKMNEKWEQTRLGVAAAFMTDDKLICCGNSKYVDIFDFSTKTFTKLKNMNTERRNSGINVDVSNNQRIYVGGGSGYADNKCEYYNIIKNEWISLPDTNSKYPIWPIIWNDNYNSNIINISAVYNCKVIEQIDIRENKWNVFLTNIDGNSSFDKLFGTEKTTAHHARLLLKSHREY